MAVRARPDNLSLVDPATQAGVDASRFDFDELWEHRESLRAICLRMAGDPTTADDVVQETFVRALSHATTLEKRASFGPWLATVARRRSVDEIRLRRRLRPVAAMPDTEIGAAEDPAEQVLKQEMVGRLRTALGELSTRERQLLLRQVTHGLSLAELAQEEDTSIASVRSVLNRARTKLRGSLERGGPLGAAPLPRLVAAVKRRLQGVAARLEGHAPLLGGAGTQLGDVVAAVIAVVALLIAGTATTPETTLISQVPAVSAEQVPSAETSTGPRPDDGIGRRASTSSQLPPPPNEAAVDQPPTAVVPPVQLPTLSDGVEQPDDAYAQAMAASDDGDTIISVGSTTSAAGNNRANGTTAMYRSDDGGKTWRRVETTGLLGHGRVLLPPTFPQQATFFVDDGASLLRTDDGHLFVPVTSTRGAAALSPRFRDGDRRIVVGSAGLASYDTDLHIVTPLAATPTSTTPSLGSLVFPPQFDRDATMLLGTGTHVGGSLRGFVQACTPLQCAQPVELPGAASPPALLASKSVPGVVMAWTPESIYRSLDGGASFTRVPTPRFRDVLGMVEGGPGDLLLVGSNPKGETTSGLFRSRDGGLTWTPLGTDTRLQRGARSALYLPTGRILAGPNDHPGILCSVDDGRTWAPRCP